MADAEAVKTPTAGALWASLHLSVVFAHGLSFIAALEQSHILYGHSGLPEEVSLETANQAETVTASYHLGPSHSANFATVLDHQYSVERE